MTLLRRLIPAVPWIHWIPVLAILGLLTWAIIDLPPDFASRQLYLRAGLLVAALGLSFAFDDSATPTTDPMPSPLWRRRVLRLVVGLVPWVTGVAILLWAGSQGGIDPVWRTSLQPDRSQLPIGRLMLEATTIASCGLAIAAVITKRWDDEPGKIASATLLGLYAVSWMVPERWKPWSDPSDIRWESVLPWWWVALSLALLVGVVSSWDSRRLSTRNFYLGRQSSILAPSWRSASRTTKPTSSQENSPKPPVSR